MSDTRHVTQAIKAHYGPRFKAALEALAKAHLANAIDHFAQVQRTGQGKPGRFWNNRTGQTAERVFGEVFSDGDSVGFFMAHGVTWGIYLELANNRQNEALRPLIEIYGNNYIVSVRELMK